MSIVFNNPELGSQPATRQDIANATATTLPYQNYLAAVTQTSTSAPTAVRFDNNFPGVTFTWGRTSAGLYTLTASVATFTANKTFMKISESTIALTQWKVAYTSTTVITLTTNLISGATAVTATDAELVGNLVEVIVMN